MIALSRSEADAALAQIRAKKTLTLPLGHRPAAFVEALAALASFIAPNLVNRRSAYGNVVKLSPTIAAQRGDIETVWIAANLLQPRQGDEIVTDFPQPDALAKCIGARLVASNTPDAALIDSPSTIDGFAFKPTARIVHRRFPASAPELAPPNGFSRVGRVAAAGLAVIDVYDTAAADPIEVTLDSLLPAEIDKLAELPQREGAAQRAGYVPPKPPESILLKPLLNAERAPINGIYERYTPRRATTPLAKPHPAELIESTTLASVITPPVTHLPRLKPDIIERGVISHAQLEAIAIAMTAHDKLLPDGTRLGVLIADGTGVGKNNEEIGLYIAGKAEGRRRAIYLTEKDRHSMNVEKSLITLGASVGEIIDARAYPALDNLPPRDGLLFMTYALLREGEDDAYPRVQQLQRWLAPDFDGLIIFDEAHNMRNAISEETDFYAQDPSRQGQAGLLLQRLFPKARIVYATATGVSDVHNIAYMERLGLWGDGAPFADRDEALKAIAEAGLTGLEMLSQHLYASGLMISRTLSLEGVSANYITHTLTPQEHDAWNTVARLLHTIRASAVSAWSAAIQDPTDRYRMPSDVNAYVESTSRRIAELMLVSLKTPTMIAHMQGVIAEGGAPVVQLMNTYEADALEDRATVERTLSDLIERIIPVVKVRKASGTKRRVLANYVPIADSHGAPIPVPTNQALKDSLLARLPGLPPMPSALEQILNAFGPTTVAEITGRSARVVNTAEGPTREQRSEETVRQELAAFMADRRRILVFSVGAGGASMDYHAALDARNQRQRYHYILQPGHRADQALQGIGRTHRSNQKQPPNLVLVSTDLPAERAYRSQMLARIRRLGATGQGHRDASSGPFAMRDSYENQYARAAFVNFLDNLVGNAYPDVTVANFQETTGLTIAAKGSIVYKADNHSIRRIMNRLARTTVEFQTTVFRHIDESMETVIAGSFADRSFDTGPEPLLDPLKVNDERIIYTDPRTGARITAVSVTGAKVGQLLSFDEALEEAEFYNTEDKTVRAAWSPVTNQVWLAITASLDKAGFPDTFRIIEPNRSTIVDIRSLSMSGAEALSMATPSGRERVRAAWDARIDGIEDATTRPTTILSGALPFLMPYLKAERHGNWRAVVGDTDDGRRIMGIMLDETVSDRLLTAIDFDERFNLSNKADPSQAIDDIKAGKTLVLAGNWLINTQQAFGENRIELHPHLSDQKRVASVKDALRLQAVRVGADTRYLVSKDAKTATKTIAAVLARHPVIRVDAQPDWKILSL